ncbi:MAG: Protein-disulfide isomerase [Saliniramus fredricksonii]|uniref:Protein-disulfide isomerase n=1 Tax=Saliniramus fredricksonii TaxID=1653334 RepID=A0A0P7X917_9HYPH|nr:DsbA family protein [Saliniramus fredricksonii]KPQ11718.1 MAG: Protein-disulfide isomerase [Saliniramus fredricksonii]SCC80196.1 Thioredoxin [Saliniramus fredricksonii]
MINRRHAMGLLVGAGAASLAFGQAAFADNHEADAGEWREMMVGSPDAPVEIIEYASLTCPHCANFRTNTYPLLRERYVDNGQVRMIFREFPLDQLAIAGFMLARCDEEQYFPIVNMLFETQRQWAFGDRPLDELAGMMRQVGFSQEKFESCLNDQAIYDGIMAVTNEGREQGVNSTPTFIVDGEIHRGALSIDQFEEILAPKLDG